MTEVLAAIAGAVLGGFATYWFQHRGERSQRAHGARIEIFGDLSQLAMRYGWLLRQPDPRGRLGERTREEIFQLANRIERVLALNDDVPEAADIIAALRSVPRFATDEARRDELDRLVDRLRRAISPKLQRALDQVHKENWAKYDPKIGHTLIVPSAFIPSSDNVDR